MTYEDVKAIQVDIHEGNRKGITCSREFFDSFVDFVDRQQATIDRYEEDIERLRTALIQEVTNRDDAKVEAIKELIGRLENDYTFEILKGDNYWEKVVRLQAIKNVAKEMVGDDK
jgi:hypothetical protein